MHREEFDNKIISYRKYMLALYLNSLLNYGSVIIVPYPDSGIEYYRY